MPTLELTRQSLIQLANRICNLFDANSVFTESVATDGKIKVLRVRNPLGNATPYFSMRFPDDLLDQYEALDDGGRLNFENRLLALVATEVKNLKIAIRNGLQAQDAFPVEFDDRLLG
ncbi:hypothetical protein [Paraburkholderia hospita]|uniref:hypothetical protein n=1 Tax=Paraburkholderia hospita TaxID=169430 RepID=UPI000B3489A3|nr:hypothetical protein [Paraburkholderia hospita]